MIGRVPSPALSDRHPGLRLAGPARPFVGLQERRAPGAAARGRRAAPHPSPAPAGLGRPALSSPPGERGHDANLRGHAGNDGSARLSCSWRPSNQPPGSACPLRQPYRHPAPHRQTRRRTARPRLVGRAHPARGLTPASPPLPAEPHPHLQRNPSAHRNAANRTPPTAGPGPKTTGRGPLPRASSRSLRRSGQSGAGAVPGWGSGFRRGRFCSTAGE